MNFSFRRKPVLLAAALTTVSAVALASTSLNKEVDPFATADHCRLYLSEGVGHASVLHTLVSAMQPVWTEAKRARMSADRVDQLVMSRCQQKQQS